ncbi:hypothetical protein [Streptomyces europaeiscabiei]|uniref:hypothetical protein n=1 Tax=Streptomyces europaeiscabiei TaxID=146819 RepID=UPI0029BB2E8E|nr:hypothetical protein [Streptomyces europaeiscabiei]MDX2766968.1 hypothetical protein [Streptomyces europaeiscabiei]
MAMSTEDASRLIFEALAHGVAGEGDTAISKLNSVCEDADGPRMYGVCCALAEAGTHMLRKLYGDQAPKTPADGMFVFQELVPGATLDDPAKTFSMRFLTAWANGDTDTTNALFSAATRASNVQYIDSVCALFADVIGITRLALDEQKKTT